MIYSALVTIRSCGEAHVLFNFFSLSNCVLKMLRRGYLFIPVIIATMCGLYVSLYEKAVCLNVHSVWFTKQIFWKYGYNSNHCIDM